MPTLSIARVAQPAVDVERRIDIARLLHVHAHEVAERRRRAHEGGDVLVGELLVEREPEVGRLDRDVRPQALGGDAVEHPRYSSTTAPRLARLPHALAEQRRVREQALGRSARGGREPPGRASRPRRSGTRRTACRACGRTSGASRSRMPRGSPFRDAALTESAITCWLDAGASAGVLEAVLDDELLHGLHLVEPADRPRVRRLVEQLRAPRPPPGRSRASPRRTRRASPSPRSPSARSSAPPARRAGSRSSADGSRSPSAALRRRARSRRAPA